MYRHISVYSYISAYIVIYRHISSHIVTYHHISSYIVIYRHISSYQYHGIPLHPSPRSYATGMQATRLVYIRVPQRAPSSYATGLPLREWYSLPQLRDATGRITTGHRDDGKQAEIHRQYRSVGSKLTPRDVWPRTPRIAAGIYCSRICETSRIRTPPMRTVYSRWSMPRARAIWRGSNFS